MRVLVLGGTGYVGREVVASLLSAGHDLRALVHRSGDGLPDAVEAVAGDVRDAGSVTAAAEGCGAIVNLVAILDGSDDVKRAGLIAERLKSWKGIRST